MLWAQWKQVRRRQAEPQRRGVGREGAKKTACSNLGPWPLSQDPSICQVLPNTFFDALGLPRLAAGSQLNPPNRRSRLRTYGGVEGMSGQPLPLSRSAERDSSPAGRDQNDNEGLRMTAGVCFCADSSAPPQKRPLLLRRCNCPLVHLSSCVCGGDGFLLREGANARGRDRPWQRVDFKLWRQT